MGQNQTLINLTAQRQPDPRSDGSPTMRGSPLSKAIDMRGLLKCEEFDGNKENFQYWKRAFYSTIDLLNPAWAVRCKTIEKAIDEAVPLTGLTVDDQAEARGLYTFLVHLCKGGSASRVAAAEENNGCEAWRVLCRAYLARSGTVALSSLTYPRSASDGPRVNIEAWDREAQRYEEIFGEAVPQVFE